MAAEPPAHDRVDPERIRPLNAFDTPTGYSGQEYDREREATEGRALPSGHPLGGPAAAVAGAHGRDIPPDNGSRARFDPADGAVRGSGVGAGGGQEGEDFDPGTPGSAPEVPRGGG